MAYGPGMRLVLFILMSIFAFAKVEYSYSYIPKKVHPYQLFPVTVFAKGLDGKDNPQFRFEKAPRGFARATENRPLKETNGENAFFTFYFKAGTDDVRIPALTIEDSDGERVLEPLFIPLEGLNIDPSTKNYCNVMASDFRVKTSQVSNFDENSNLLYLTIEAHEANIEDMDIPDPSIMEQGIEKLQRHHSLVNAEYYIVIPANKKSLTFSYYDTIKRKSVPIEISTMYKSRLVAAQDVDLNPKDSSFTKLKKYTFAALSIFFLIMLLIKRDFFYLVLLVITLITLTTFFIPHRKICVRQGSPLYILPISSSTIGTRIGDDIELPVLDSYGEYYKIQYRPGVIGWIKDSDVCKD
jgi:hypothetical protein